MSDAIATSPLAMIPSNIGFIVMPATGWVAKELFIRVKGMTDGQIRGYIQRNEWKSGQHFIVKGRCTYINIEAIESWLVNSTQPVSDPACVVELKSAGRSMENHFMSLSTKRRRKHT